MLWLIWLVISIGLPIYVIYLLAKVVSRAFGHGKDKKEQKPISDRDFILAFIAAPAAIAGIGSINLLAENIGPDINDDAGPFLIRVIGGIVVLLVGIILTGITGKMLMLMSIFMFAMALPFVFDSLGDMGVFLIVFLAFIALIVVVLKMNKGKGANSG